MASIPARLWQPAQRDGTAYRFHKGKKVFSITPLSYSHFSFGPFFRKYRQYRNKFHVC